MASELCVRYALCSNMRWPAPCAASFPTCGAADRAGTFWHDCAWKAIARSTIAFAIVGVKLTQAASA
jgi:hypothetical protein